MNFLISGAGGYLGSRLCAALRKAGHGVIPLVREQKEDVPEALTREQIRARRRVSLSIDAAVNCSVCYGRNGESDVEVASVNLIDSLALLEFSFTNRIPFFLNIGSAMEPGINAYTFSKRQFSDWGKFYADHGKISFVDLVFEHFYGPDEKDLNKFVAFVVDALLRNVPVLELTAGEQLRDFLHIDDGVRAVMTVVAHLGECSGYRAIPVGSGKAVRIRELVELVSRFSGSRSELRFGAVPYRKNEMMYSRAETSILRQWGWKPEIGLEAGLKQVVECAKCEY